MYIQNFTGLCTKIKDEKLQDFSLHKGKLLVLVTFAIVLEIG